MNKYPLPKKEKGESTADTHLKWAVWNYYHPDADFQKGNAQRWVWFWLFCWAGYDGDSGT